MADEVALEADEEVIVVVVVDSQEVVDEVSFLLRRARLSQQ